MYFHIQIVKKTEARHILLLCSSIMKSISHSISITSRTRSTHSINQSINQSINTFSIINQQITQRSQINQQNQRNQHSSINQLTNQSTQSDRSTINQLNQSPWITIWWSCTVISDQCLNSFLAFFILSLCCPLEIVS